MRYYSFYCENCDSNLEIKLDPANLDDAICPHCKTKKHMYRDYQMDNIQVIGPQHTLGSLADKNTHRFSEDYKQEIKNKCRTL